jgi:hypothetical protein
MAITNWEIITNEGFIHGIDFSSGLNLPGSFCYATELTSGPALIAIKNKIITDKANIKISAYIRKECNNLEPFIFLRYDSVSGEAYVIKLESNINLYKLDLTDKASIPSQQPLKQGTTTIINNTTYHVSLYSYSLIDGSTVFECGLFDGTAWQTELSHVISPDIESGDLGFGTFYKFSSVNTGCKKSYFDNIEILSPIVFV